MYSLSLVLALLPAAVLAQAPLYGQCTSQRYCVQYKRKTMLTS
jgi:hypothetical protein